MVVYITTTKIHDGKISVANSTENMLDAEGIVNIFSFETENGKKINIYFEYSSSDNNDLSGYIGYILLDNNENVEFIYPILGKMKTDFIYKKTKNELIFKNENTEYTIYESNGKIGIKIFLDGKNYNWKGSHVIQGDLNKINDFDIKNITIQD